MKCRNCQTLWEGDRPLCPNCGRPAEGMSKPPDAGKKLSFKMKDAPAQVYDKEVEKLDEAVHQEHPHYHLKKPAFVHDDADRAAAREELKKRIHKHKAHRRLGVLFILLVLGAASGIGVWLLTRGAANEGGPAIPVEAGEGECALTLVNESGLTLTLRIGSRVATLQPLETERVIIPMGLHATGWSASVGERTIYETGGTEDLAAAATWTFSVDDPYNPQSIHRTAKPNSQ